MPQTRGRLFDDLSRLMTDAAGLAEGAKREVETLARAQLERLMAGMDLVSREEFEAVREMAALARSQNDKLEARIAALEAKLAAAVVVPSVIREFGLIRSAILWKSCDARVYAANRIGNLAAIRAGRGHIDSGQAIRGCRRPRSLGCA